MRTHYQEAIDVYKRLLLDHRDHLAINVYVAQCYYRLEYFDVSQEILLPYLQVYPTSFIAANLKACIHYRLYNGRAAEEELKPLTDILASKSHGSRMFGEEIVRHNVVVFRNGKGALQVLPDYVDVIPEARVNLVIYHLRNDEYQAAYDLLEDVEPSNPIVGSWLLY